VNTNNHAAAKCNGPALKIERERERERESSVVAAQRGHVSAVKVQSKMEMVRKGNKPYSTSPAFI
jgi:hypothetical protein